MADPASTAPLPPALVIDSRGARTLHFPGSDIQSRMQLDDPHALDLDYTRTMMGFLLFVPDPRRICAEHIGQIRPGPKPAQPGRGGIAGGHHDQNRPKLRHFQKIQQRAARALTYPCRIAH